MAKSWVLLWLCTFALVNLEPQWHEIFKRKLEQKEYHQAHQLDIWGKWIDQNDMQMLCVNATEHQMKTGKELTAKDMLDPNLAKQNVGKAFLGKPILDQRCDLVFPPSKTKTLQQVLELLWGYTQMGFFPFDPVGGKYEKTTLVVIHFKGDSRHKFRLKLQSKDGNIIYNNLQEDLKYLDQGTKKGCFCNLDRAVNKVDLTWEVLPFFVMDCSSYP